MSTYYDFYAAVKKNDKIEAIGPYIRKEGEYRLVPIVSRSRSFIHFDEFDYWDLPIEKMIDDQIQFFTCEGWTGEERRSIACYIPYEDIRAMADDGLVQGYVTLAGSVITTSQVNSFFQRVCENAGLPKLGQHALRHTFATRCIESGIPAVVLKTWLGHKDIHVTLDTYTDIFKAMDNGALEKFDAYIDAM